MPWAMPDTTRAPRRVSSMAKRAAVRTPYSVALRLPTTATVTSSSKRGSLPFT